MIHKQWLRVQCLDLSNPHDRISSTHLKGLILIAHIVLHEIQRRAIEYALTNICLLDYCYYTIVKVLVTWTSGCQKFAVCHIHISITLNLQCTLDDYSIIHMWMDKADFSPLFLQALSLLQERVSPRIKMEFQRNKMSVQSIRSHPCTHVEICNKNFK